jgi:hypothetical protein
MRQSCKHAGLKYDFETETRYKSITSATNPFTANISLLLQSLSLQFIMRFIIFLLLCAHSIVSALSSTHTPDLQSRDQSVNYYKVFPIAHEHFAQTIPTWHELSKLCGEARPFKLPNRTVAYWRAVSKDSRDIIQDLRAVQGVRLVERMDASGNTISDAEHHDSLAPRQLDEYVVFVDEGSDVVKIENFLKTKIQKGTSYYPMESNDEILGWGGVVLDDAAKAAVKAYEGVRSIMVDAQGEEGVASPTRERTLDSRRISNHPDQPLPETDHPQLVRRDFESCSCLVKNISDIKQVEEFLKSKIQSGSKYYPYRRKDEILGWYNLILDSDAQKAVKEYDGVEYFKVGVTKLIRYRALPGTEPSLSPRNTHKSLEKKKNAILPRAGEWVKQTTTDQALKMDSQYP